MKRILCLLSLFIFFSLVAFPQSDLIWYGTVTLNPAAPNEGDSVKFTAVVRATVADSKAFAVKGGIDGTELFSKNCPALLKTTKNTVTFTWTATAGNHTVYFEIDPNQTSGDINYNNNYIEVPFTVGTGTTPPPPPRRNQQANLVIKNVTWNPQSFGQGDMLSLSFQVVNTGNADALMSHAKVEICNATVGSASVKALQPGDFDNITMSGLASSCPALIIIKIDINNAVAESNENDNEWSQSVNCGVSIILPSLQTDIDPSRRPKRPRGPGDPKPPQFTIVGTPNLVVSDVSWTPKTFNEGDKVTFTYTAKNIGNGIASPRPSLSFTAENGQAKVMAPGAPGTQLYPGDSLPLRKFVWTAKCDTKITIAVDDEKAIIETDEMDNYFIKTFYQNECKKTFIPDTSNQNLPNLRVTSSSLRPLRTGWNPGTIFNFSIGDTAVDITYTIKNDSNVPAVATKYQLIINNQVIITDKIDLAPNQEKQVGWYAKVNCGSTFVLKLDYNNILIESNEFDNQSTAGPWPKCN